MKMIKESIMQGFLVLVNPEKEFYNFQKKSLEELVSKYMILLLLSGFLAGTLNFLISIVKAFYYNIVFKVDIDYFRLLNYSFGKAAGIMLLLFFLGTFITFIVSIILNSVYLKTKYSVIIKIMIYALTPILFLGWIYPAVFPLIIWSVILFVLGMRYQKETPKIKKGSVNFRD